ncbi:hypothetical protein KIN20_024506 [Parelaphostrongylus tenuis]|uniref:Uncharacterized protein n=1 Tax=Parelaphostrongylus tenuis TaxID=148309 RepID=A0AAD5MYC7_PARTN|nr:hypothetical protein KIN20_024506 [Parelaphostrongylus tenuis]
MDERLDEPGAESQYDEEAQLFFVEAQLRVYQCINLPEQYYQLRQGKKAQSKKPLPDPHKATTARDIVDREKVLAKVTLRFHYNTPVMLVNSCLIAP